MDFLKLERNVVEKFTTLDIALRVCDKAEFLVTKKQFLSFEYNKEKQIKIWQDFHPLMEKAIRHERFTDSETRRRRKDKKFCSPRCRLRTWRKK